MSVRDRFRGAAPSSLDVGAGRDLAGGLEEVDEDEGEDDGEGGWHGSDDRRARLEALTGVESTIAITLGVYVVVEKRRKEEIRRKCTGRGWLRRRRTYVVAVSEEDLPRMLYPFMYLHVIFGSLYFFGSHSHAVSSG
jgi:hypothetical protein